MLDQSKKTELIKRSLVGGRGGGEPVGTVATLRTGLWFKQADMQQQDLLHTLKHQLTIKQTYRRIHTYIVVQFQVEPVYFSKKSVAMKLLIVQSAHIVTN